MLENLDKHLSLILKYSLVKLNELLEFNSNLSTASSSQIVDRTSYKQLDSFTPLIITAS